jgi:hypothetical protein
LLLSFDDDTSNILKRVVCNFEDCVRTFVLLTLFAVAPAGRHADARKMMAEVPKTNPVRLLVLIPRIHKALQDALAQEPENVEVRLDLVRFYMVTPSILGGDEKEARTQAAEIARRDPALGHFARGYIAYREKEYGPGRRELREAMRTGNASTRALAAQWLGWLSQETQQWDEAFAMFEELGDRYEIARTAEFCSCRLEQGRAALREHLRLHPKDENARKLRKKLAR